MKKRWGSFWHILDPVFSRGWEVNLKCLSIFQYLLEVPNGSHIPDLWLWRLRLNPREGLEHPRSCSSRATSEEIEPKVPFQGEGRVRTQVMEPQHLALCRHHPFWFLQQPREVGIFVSTSGIRRLRFKTNQISQALQGISDLQRLWPPFTAALKHPFLKGPSLTSQRNPYLSLPSRSFSVPLPCSLSSESSPLLNLLCLFVSFLIYFLPSHNETQAHKTNKQKPWLSGSLMCSQQSRRYLIDTQQMFTE